MTDTTPATPPPAAAPAGRLRPWLWFVAWFVVGALFCLGLLAIMTIGVFVLAVAVIAAIVLATRPGSARGLPGLLSGLALPVLYVAYLNRSGPGTVCHAISGGTECTDEWSPWPWLVIGLVLLAAGVVLMVILTIDKRPRSA